MFGSYDGHLTSTICTGSSFEVSEAYVVLSDAQRLVLGFAVSTTVDRPGYIPQDSGAKHLAHSSTMSRRKCSR